MSQAQKEERRRRLAEAKHRELVEDSFRQLLAQGHRFQRIAPGSPWCICNRSRSDHQEAMQKASAQA